MWKVYVNGTGGVAIQSSIKGLKEAFNDCAETIHFGKIEYVDFARHAEAIDINFRRLMRKDMAFKHEQEVRAVFDDKEQKHGNERGINIKVNIKTLVENIVVASRADQWFLELVKALVKELGQPIPVISSAMARAVSLTW